MGTRSYHPQVQGSTDAARRLVLEHGWNSTSHQVLDPGMRRWFSAAGDAVVGYVEVASVRVVAGAPVAAEDRLAEVALEFEEASLAAGRQVCYFAAERRLVEVARHRRYASHVIGMQPIWSAAGWAPRFDASASLRAQRNRARNKGVQVYESEAITELDADLRACHDAWLARKGLPRLRFLAHSEAGLSDGARADRRLFIARLRAPGAPRETGPAAELGVGRETGPAPAPGAPEFANGGVVGYLSLAPVPRRRGWLVEKLVRHPRAPNGTSELLLDEALRTVADGSERFTLGLSPLAGRRDQDEWTPHWLRLAERLAVRHGRRLYDFSGLHAFKAKFDPEAWEPVYLLSTEERLTPRTFVALAGAFLGVSDGSRPGGRAAGQRSTAQRGWWSMPS